MFVSFDSGPVLSFEIFQQQSSMRVQELVSTGTDTETKHHELVEFLPLSM